MLLGYLTERFMGRKTTRPEEYYSAAITAGEEMSSRYAWDAKANAAIQAYVSITWTCASRVAQMCASTQLRLYKPISTSGKTNVSRGRKAWLRTTGACGPGSKAAIMAQRADEFEEITEHPLLDLLNDPSTFEIGVTSAQLRFVNKMLAGDAFTLKERPSPNAPPTALYDLCPAYVRVVPSKTEFISAYRYGRDSVSQKDFQPEDVIHFIEERDPQIPYRGRGVMAAIAMEHQVYIAATQKQLVLMDNNARPDFLVSVADDMSEPTKKSLRQEIDSYTRGVKKSGRFLLLPKSTTITPAQFNPKDLGEIEAQRFLAASIAGAFGIAESEIFMNSANLASAEVGRVATARTAVLPRLQKDAATINERLVHDFPDLAGAWVSYDNPVPEDDAKRSTVLVSLVSSGIMTLDEARAELGYEPYEDELGDEPRVNGQPLSAAPDDVTAGMPIGSEDGADGNNQLGSDPAGGDGVDGGDGGDAEGNAQGKGMDHGGHAGPLVSGNNTDRCAQAKDTWVRDSGGVDKDAPACGGRSEKQSDTVSRIAVVLAKSVDLNPPGNQQEPTDVRWFRALRKGFRDQRDSILAAMDAAPFGLKSSRIRKENYGDPVVAEMMRAWGITDYDTLDKRLMELTKEYVPEALHTGVKIGLAELVRAGWEQPEEDSFYVDSHNVVESARRQGLKYASTISGVNQETAKRLASAITVALENGDGLHKMKQAIKDAFNGLTPEGVSITDYRAAMIARTESARAQSQGHIAGWKSSEAVMGKKWLLAPGCCEFCEAVAKDFTDKPIGLDESFVQKGDTVDGADGGQFVCDYESVSAPPLHPHCRCAVQPVLKGAV